MAFLLEVEDCIFKVFKTTKCRSSQNKVKSLNLGKIGCKSGSRIDASDATLASQKLIFKLISFLTCVQFFSEMFFFIICYYCYSGWCTNILYLNRAIPSRKWSIKEPTLLNEFDTTSFFLSQLQLQITVRFQSKQSDVIVPLSWRWFSCPREQR